MHHDPSLVQSVCQSCGRSLFVRYDLDRGTGEKLRSGLSAGVSTLWRYRELLPVRSDANIVSLGEGFTPLLRMEGLAERLGLTDLWLKDEAFNPTGSFKARGMALAVSMAKELGITELCVPTAGNAGGALAAYAAAAGVRSHIYMPDDTPVVNVSECRAYGADVRLVPGLINDAAAMMNREKQEGWFDVSTLKEPYRVEGKKTLGYEIDVRDGEVEIAGITSAQMSVFSKRRAQILERLEKPGCDHLPNRGWDGIDRDVEGF